MTRCYFSFDVTINLDFHTFCIISVRDYLIRMWGCIVLLSSHLTLSFYFLYKIVSFIVNTIGSGHLIVRVDPGLVGFLNN